VEFDRQGRQTVFYQQQPGPIVPGVVRGAGGGRRGNAAPGGNRARGGGVRNGDPILVARKFRNGQVAYLTYQGNYVRLDRAGNELKTYRVSFNQNIGTSGADLSPDDHVVIASANLNKVAEFGPDGKTIWEASLPQPAVPNRLPNGHTVVVSRANAGIVELDRNGRVVCEWRDLKIRPWMATRH
jgi:hypothetical protein